MQNRSLGMVACAAALAFAGLALARQEKTGQTAKYSSGAKNFTKDPDISGIWTEHPSASQRAFAVYGFLDAKDLAPLMTPLMVSKE